MKREFLLIFLILTVVEVCASKACYVNPFIKERASFSENPLKYYTETMNVTTNNELKSKCAGEWAKHGLCCNPYDLPSHLENEGRRLKTSIQYISTYFSFIDIPVAKIFTVIKQLSLSTPDSNHAGYQTIIAAAKNYLNKGANLAAINELKDFPSASDKRIFNDSLTKCWDYMAKKRAASICSTCSGRSEVFFKNNKGLLTTSICSESLSVCLTPLKYSIKFLKVVKWLHDNAEFFTSLTIRSGVESWSQKANINNIASQITSNSIFDLLQKSSLSKEEELKVCSEYFSLAKESYLVKIMNYAFIGGSQSLELDEPAKYLLKASLSQITAGMPALETRLAANLLAWNSAKTITSIASAINTLVKSSTTSITSARALATGDLFFASDVSFFPETDSLFTSFVGATGTINEVYKPMNLSTCFP